jgi:hypothetical protein
VKFYQTTHHHIPEERTLLTYLELLSFLVLLSINKNNPFYLLEYDAIYPLKVNLEV